MDSVRTCSVCHQTKPIINFNKVGLICKKCKHNRYKIRYETDEKYRKYCIENAKKQSSSKSREQIRTIQRKAQKKYKEKNHEKTSKIRNNGAYMNRLGITDLLWARSNGYCEWCAKIIFKRRGGYAIHHLNNNREDNRLENLIVCCTACHLHYFHSREKSLFI